MKRLVVILLMLVSSLSGNCAYMLIPMDDSQTDHLKAYGLTYWSLEQGLEAWWLLNYRGGSFIIGFSSEAERECILRNVSY
ncbi:MAG: asparagine synthetase B, partial [Bacteroidales bacterium]|nr:asparagine synthetase B [Bacteroidales bacterium]